MAHEPKWAHHLFLYDPQAKNDFYIFKWLKSILEKNHISWDENYMEIQILVSIHKVLNFVNKNFVEIHFLSLH